MIRLGLCCLFRQAPIKFRSTTATSLLRLTDEARLEKLDQLCFENAQMLLAAVGEVKRLGIGAFRVLSPFFPLYTHPEAGYQLDQLPSAQKIYPVLSEVKKNKDHHQLRLSFHPDQFVLLSSPRAEVTSASLQELAYQAELAELIGADVINIHAGGVYGDKKAALKRLADQIKILPEPIRSRLTLENDDRSYSVSDLVPLCKELSVPLVFDVHHHRCLPDGLTIEQATAACLESWERVGREPYLHISSPKHGWNGNAKPHADYIDLDDFPPEWLTLNATIDVEAKAKELAVLKLKQELKLPDWNIEGVEHV